MAATGIVDVIGTANIKDTLGVDEADHALWRVLRYAPQLVGLEEWARGNPFADVKDLNARLARILERTGYTFARPSTGGNPIVYGAKRYYLLNCYGALLHKAGDVGRLSGRRTHLGASVATVGIFEDLVLGGTTALVVMHLTAEVQKGKGYRLDPAHALRVLRHRRERRALRLLVLDLRRQGHRVYVVGDTNYDAMPLPPLVACWIGHGEQEAAGTLGSRTVDYVYAEQAADRVITIPDASDHDAVIARYPR